MKRKPYQPPRTETIRVHNEGIMAGSPLNMPGTPGIDNTRSSSASKQDLEDMINDILTVRK